MNTKEGGIFLLFIQETPSKSLFKAISGVYPFSHIQSWVSDKFLLNSQMGSHINPPWVLVQFGQ